MGMDSKTKLKCLDLMIKTRALEERLIKMSKSGEGFFWIGGPGEEGFNIPLGLQVKKGQGLDYDYFHLHYRSSGIMLAMGAEIIDTVRQMHYRQTDPYSMGRNFVNHYSINRWNVTPTTPTIETQYLIAPGTAWAQKRHGGTGITIVNGGDAGTAEGDFTSCLVWSTMPGKELPVLIIVTNNHYGISTPESQVHGEKSIAERGRAFGIEIGRVNGNNPEEAWDAINAAMEYIRKKRRPFLLEANVSRLHGHSSSTGGAYVDVEYDPTEEFAKKLIKEKIIDKAGVEGIWEKYRTECEEALAQAKTEPEPDPETRWMHIYKEEGRSL